MPSALNRLNISPNNRCDALQKVRFWDPEHWRFRAEETRTVADQMTHEEARTIMRRIAMDYDRLAKCRGATRRSGSDWTKNLEPIAHSVARIAGSPKGSAT